MTHLLYNPPKDKLAPADIVSGLQAGDAEFALKKADMRRVLLGLANSIYRARLKSGARLCDAIDFKRWLEELAELLK